jgi:NAD-dependent SIR2 family protein deacetylase
MSHVPALARFVDEHPRLFVLTGAGVSTASGIPDYRDANGDWKRKSPILLQEFINDDFMRRRYWARSLIGWRHLSKAQPNAAHDALAELEAQGRIELLVTQNVDGLHQAAGSNNVVDLHGRIDTIRCLSCDSTMPRKAMQDAVEQLNPEFARLDARSAPDGDADLDDIDFSRFDVPGCRSCNGMLKPDVVFFGERVPDVRVEQAMAAVDTADAMLIVGSSLMVWSGFRFAKAAAAAGKPIAAINMGRTRADDLLQLKLERSCTEVLPLLTTSRNLPA